MKNDIPNQWFDEFVLYEKAKRLAINALCDVKCLCPKSRKNASECQCDVLFALTKYYFETLQEE